jgi:hypothetical protein
MLLPYARSKGKAIAVESSANTIWAFPVLAQLFPQAKFINVIRDGRDVVASHRNVAQRLFERGLPDTSNAGSALQTGAMWREVVNVGNSLCGPQADLAREGRAITVRYEDLVFAPVQELQRICRLLDVQFDQEMLHPEARSHDGAIDDIWITSANATRTISTDSIGRWLSELPFRERMLFMAAAQDTLVAVHYEINDEWSMRNLTISQEDALLELELVQEEIALMQQPTAQQVEASHDAGMNDGALKIEKVVVDSASATGLAPTALKSDPQEPPASIAPIRR